MEIRSTTSRSRLGWLCVHDVTSQSDFLIALSDDCEQSHRDMSEKGPQLSGRSRSTVPRHPEVILEPINGNNDLHQQRKDSHSSACRLGTVSTHTHTKHETRTRTRTRNTREQHGAANFHLRNAHKMRPATIVTYFVPRLNHSTRGFFMFKRTP